MVLTVMTRIEMLVLACEVCFNECVLSGLGEGMLRYALFLGVCGYRARFKEPSTEEENDVSSWRDPT